MKKDKVTGEPPVGIGGDGDGTATTETRRGRGATKPRWGVAHNVEAMLVDASQEGPITPRLFGTPEQAMRALAVELEKPDARVPEAVYLFREIKVTRQIQARLL